MENTPTNVSGIISQQAAKPKTKAKTPAQLMQGVVNVEASQALLKNSLKENAGAFTASIIDLYASDTYLQNCAPQAVFAEALKAVSLKLPINKQLGFAYIIPRRDHGVWKPTFQLGYKGYIQLCMRTGAYRYINAGPVYEGELQKVDKLSGEVDLSGEPAGEDAPVIGYFAYMETLNGFRKCLYWPNEKLLRHVKRYSDSYKSGSKIWKDNFEEMAIKTVLRYLLSHWGVMSTEMEQAFKADNVEAADQMIAGDNAPEYIPAQAEEIPAEALPDAPEVIPDAQ